MDDLSICIPELKDIDPSPELREVNIYIVARLDHLKLLFTGKVEDDKAPRSWH